MFLSFFLYFAFPLSLLFFFPFFLFFRSSMHTRGYESEYSLILALDLPFSGLFLYFLTFFYLSALLVSFGTIIINHHLWFRVAPMVLFFKKSMVGEHVEHMEKKKKGGGALSLFSFCFFFFFFTKKKTTKESFLVNFFIIIIILIKRINSIKMKTCVVELYCVCVCV